jgi:oligopeptide/dipeptide ABC transporter ATP-binding protein
VPRVEQNREPIPIRRSDGARPDLAIGCRFRDRCLHAFDRCVAEQPTLRNVAHNHRVACHLDLWNRP